MRSNETYDTCRSALRWAKQQGYRGYDPYDGLNSPILSFLSRNWLTRLVAIHGVSKAPVNLRPLLGVPKERNPKGIALFASSYLNLYDLTGDNAFLKEAESLLEWLRDNQSNAFERPCWGYNFDWQNGQKFFLPAGHPSIVVTVFCGNAFYQHYTLTENTRSLDMATSAAEFIRTQINQRTIGDHDVFTYTPYDSFVVINANALAADFFYRMALSVEDNDLRELADQLFDFVCSAQTSEGAWYYAMPATESHLSHDNFHTGFILESLHDYAMSETTNEAFRDSYQRGMEFYSRHLFESNGAPKFEADTRYPYDAHAAAQGIITFAQRGEKDDLELANKIASWAHENLWDEEGYFYRQVGRVLTDQTPYIRWSQAWMCVALSKLCMR